MRKERSAVIIAADPADGNTTELDFPEDRLPAIAGSQPLTALRKQATFREGLQRARRRKQELDWKLLRASEPLERAELEHELAQLHSTQLTAEVLSDEFRKQHAALVLGTHPQEGAIRIFCEQRQVEYEVLLADEDLFAEMMFHLPELQVVAQEKQQRDEQVLPALVAFLEGTHSDQALLETLNAMRAEDLRELKGEKLLREFARTNDQRQKLLVDEGLRESERRRQEELRREQELQELRSRLEELERVAGEREHRVQQLEEQLSGRARRRQEILQRVREIRREERRKAARDELVLHDAIYGYLIAETWRQLDCSLAEGKWELAVRNDHYFFLELKEMLEAVDFEERYLRNQEGMAAIEAVNRYRRGDISRAELTGVPGLRVEWLSDEEKVDEPETEEG